MQRILILSMMAICLVGCARFSPKSAKYETIKGSPIKNTKRARRMHEKALTCLECDDAVGAEQLLNESLLADRDFGPAHNTLGKLYFDQRKFYLAAWEFEYANSLMPERAEPLNNLGLVMESVEQIEEAIGYYRQAREIDDDNAEYLGNLLRAQIRKGTDPSYLTEELKELIFLDKRPVWSDWAKSLLRKVEINGGSLEEYVVPEIPDASLAPRELNGESNKK